MKKKVYMPPVIEVAIVHMEEGLASGSATLRPIGPNDEDYPEVNDWINDGSQAGDLEL